MERIGDDTIEDSLILSFRKLFRGLAISTSCQLILIYFLIYFLIVFSGYQAKGNKFLFFYKTTKSFLEYLPLIQLSNPRFPLSSISLYPGLYEYQ